MALKQAEAELDSQLTSDSNRISSSELAADFLSTLP